MNYFSINMKAINIVYNFADRSSLSGSSFHIKTDDSFKSERGDTSIVEDMYVLIFALN